MPTAFIMWLGDKLGSFFRGEDEPADPRDLPPLPPPPVSPPPPMPPPPMPGPPPGRRE